MKNKIFIVFLSCFLIGGCAQQHDAQYYLKHPQALKSILVQCHQMTPVKDAALCARADHIYEELSGLAQSMMADPQAFGKQIIQLQIKRGQLQNQLAVLSKEQTTDSQEQIKSLQKQIQGLDEQIKIMLTMVAEAEGM